MGQASSSQQPQPFFLVTTALSLLFRAKTGHAAAERQRQGECEDDRGFFEPQSGVSARHGNLHIEYGSGSPSPQRLARVVLRSASIRIYHTKQGRRILADATPEGTLQHPW